MQGGSKHARHADHGNHGNLAIAEKYQKNRAGKKNADNQRLPHACGGGDNKLTLVIPVGDFNP